MKRMTKIEILVSLWFIIFAVYGAVHRTDKLFNPWIIGGMALVGILLGFMIDNEHFWTSPYLKKEREEYIALEPNIETRYMLKRYASGEDTRRRIPWDD